MVRLVQREASSHMDRARILVVEAEEPVALAIKDCLERLGYEVPDVLATGEEAAEKSVTLAADLVLIGAHLSGAMSGTDAARLIRDSTGVPAVHLSSLSDTPTEPFGFVLKPIEERSLEATVKMALSRSREQKRAGGPERRVEVRISDDRMTAVASFSAPAASAGRIELDEVRDLLTAKGVRFGIDWDLVNSSILSCNTSRTALVDREIAHGQKPSNEVDRHLDVEPSLLTKAAPESSETRAIDFKALSPFQLVKKGDILARVSPRTEGAAGVDVTGAAVAYGRTACATLRPGKNTLAQGDSVVAGCDGKFVLGEDSFWVSEVLEISGDVDYSTGHIDFPGDVIVRGQIKQGFNVKAGGSLTCARTIDASEISCGGDLETDQGILGRPGSIVKVGGRVRAKFIENCSVEAGGDVLLTTGCLNSAIKALGAVCTGPKGVIIGGRIDAVKGVTAFQIGSPAGVRTEICCGEDSRVQQKLAWIKDKNAELGLALKDVEARLAARGQGDPHLLQARDNLKTAMHKMSDSAKGLAALLDKNKESTVAAAGEIHRGVLVELCHVPFAVAQSMSGVRLVLDRTSNVITPQRLGRA